MLGFNVEKMLIDSKKAIEYFAKQHQEETFYAFSIDSNMLCLNSMEKFNENLNFYQKKYPEHYSKQEDIEALKFNTGDWEYQGFFHLEEGFDHDLYSDHYNLPIENNLYDGDAMKTMLGSTAYHLAMQSLMEKILDSNVFDYLNKTPDFFRRIFFDLV